VGLRDNGTNFTVDYESGENVMFEYFGNLFSGKVAQSDGLSPTQERPRITSPLVVLILVLVFWTAVSTKTQQAGLEPRRGSSIATLFHGLNAKSFGDLRAIRTVHAMDATAGQLAVRLDEDSDGLGLLAGRSRGL
jgi:hypothetical protein